MDHDPRCCAPVDPDHDERDRTAATPAQRPPGDPLAEVPGGSPTPPTSTPATTPVSDEEAAHAVRGAERIDWVTAQADLDECDGYVVLAVDPQTGEVDSHGPFPGLDALRTADGMRATLDREGLDDVVVRVVRWHQDVRLRHP